MQFFNRMVGVALVTVGAWCFMADASAQYVRRDGLSRASDPVPRTASPSAATPVEPAAAPAAATRQEQAPEDLPPMPADGRVEIDADRLEYDADRQLMVGIGRVQIRQFNDILRADYVELHTETQEAMARGNVYFERDGRVWRGEQFTYNFQTRIGDFGEFHFFTDPFYIRAVESQQVATNVIYLKSASLTTCSDEDRLEFVIRSRSATLTDGRILRAKHVVTSLYGVPIFYTPYLKRDLSRSSNFRFTPGYSSRMGAFLLSSYNFYPIPHVRSRTMLDYRSKRGIAGGQQFRWQLPENNARGRAIAYYLDDDLPIRGEGQREIREGLVESGRYWLGFRHSQSVAPRRTLIADVNYVSDPFVLEDFFEEEFSSGVQPENRVTLTHRGDNFTAALLLNARLNDFYDNVNRLPEASLDISRQEMGATGFFYEGENRVSFLERVFPEQSEDEDYDAFRLDSLHTVLYPMRHFGFLSVIPSVGYRGTYYSKTKEAATITNLVTQVDEEGVPLADEEGNPLFDETTETLLRDGPAELRSLMEFGVETSFKAFKVLNERPNYLGQGLRHIAEPYAKYTLVPEPNIRPAELYQFDTIDSLDEQHDVRLGMRNKWQTRGGESRIHDFVDLNTYTIYRIDPEEFEEDFDHFFFDARINPTERMQMILDGSYDWYESEILTFNSLLSFYLTDWSTFSFEYRFARDSRESVISSITLFPDAKWSYTGYWRFDLDESELEEQTYLIERRFDCTSFGLGVRGRLDDDGDTDWRVWAQVTLLAFPDSEWRIGR